MEPLATQLGVTKGGFYRFFPDRTAFLSALLDEWERRSIDEVITQVDAEGRDAASNIRRAGAMTFAEDLLPVDLAVRAWARTAPEVAERLRRVDNARMGYLRAQMAQIVSDPADIEARSMLAFALAIGQHFITAEHTPLSRSDTLGLATTFLTAPQRSRKRS